jgi:hypothetical protein
VLLGSIWHFAQGVGLDQALRESGIDFGQRQK